jgi:hypothetical protein
MIETIEMNDKNQQMQDAIITSSGQKQFKLEIDKIMTK